MIRKWTEHLKNGNFRTQWIITSLVSIPLLMLLVYVLDFVEKRNGVCLPDPFLAALAPMDLSVFIFVLLYSLTLLGTAYLLNSPENALLMVQSYLLVLLMRMLCMYLAPLEAPAGILPLHDFLLEKTFYSGNVNVKDLFFSGHTAVIFLFFVNIPYRRLRMAFLGGTFAIGAALLFQHAHYTIDVLAAPAASYLAYLIVRNTCGKRHVLRQKGE